MSLGFWTRRWFWQFAILRHTFYFKYYKTYWKSKNGYLYMYIAKGLRAYNDKALDGMLWHSGWQITGDTNTRNDSHDSFDSFQIFETLENTRLSVAAGTLSMSLYNSCFYEYVTIK